MPHILISRIAPLTWNQAMWLARRAREGTIIQDIDIAFGKALKWVQEEREE